MTDEPILAMSIADACKAAGLGRSKLYESISAGTLASRKCGKRRLILLQDLREFLHSLPVDGSAV